MCDHGDRANPKKELEKPREKLAQILQNIFNETPAAGCSSVTTQPRTAISHSFKFPKPKPVRIALSRSGSYRAGAYRCPSCHSGPTRSGPCRSIIAFSGPSRSGSTRGSPRPAAARSGVARPATDRYSPTRLNNPHIKSQKAVCINHSDPKLLFAGRYMTKVERAEPFEVSKRFVGPHMKQNIGDYPDPERIVRKIFRIKNLNNVLLLITPSFEKQKDKHIVHGFAIDTKQHLGVTSLTTLDREHIERFHSSLNYSLMYCSIYLELKDAYMNKQIREKIFSTLSMRSMVPVGSFYRDRMITLRYRHFPTHKIPPRTLGRTASDNSILRKSNISSKVTRNVSESSICLRAQQAADFGLKKDENIRLAEGAINAEETHESKGDSPKVNESKHKLDECKKVKIENKINLKDGIKKERKDHGHKNIKMMGPRTEAKQEIKNFLLINKNIHLKNEDKKVKKTHLNRSNLKKDGIKYTNPKVEVPKVEVSKVEVPKVEVPNPEPPKKDAEIKSEPKNCLPKKNYLRKVLPKVEEYKYEKTKRVQLSVPLPKPDQSKKITHPKIEPQAKSRISKEPQTILNKPTEPKVHSLKNTAKIVKPKPIEPNLSQHKTVESKIKSTFIHASQSKKSLKEVEKKTTMYEIPAEGIPNTFEPIKVSQKNCHHNHADALPPDELKNVKKTPKYVNRQIKYQPIKLTAANANKVSPKFEPAVKKTPKLICKDSLERKNMPKINKSLASQSSVRSLTTNVPANFRRRVYDCHGRWREDFKTIVKPHRLHESKGAIHMPAISRTPQVQFNNTSSVIEAKSSLFERLMEPLALPEHFSQQACEHIRTRLCQIEAKQAFLKFDKLMQKINKNPVPRYRHLMTFFKLVMLLDIKLFVREEICWPGFSPADEPRYQVECFVFDDRQDFLVSLALLCRQLQEFADIFPAVRRNLRYIDDAFDLTIIPTPVTKCLRSIMNKLHSKRLFKFFAEIAYDFIQPLPTPVNVIREKPQSEQDEDVIQQVKRMEEALKILKAEYTP